MNDRELLELAAKAAGLKINTRMQAERDEVVDPAKAGLWLVDGTTWWDPLDNDGQALRLAVKLHIEIAMHPGHDTVCCEPKNDPTSIMTTEVLDGYGVRRAITRAAAEIGKSMP